MIYKPTNITGGPHPVGNTQDLSPHQETGSSSPLAAVPMASFVGLILGLSSSPQMANAEEAKGKDGVVAVDKKAKLKAEIEKAQAAIQKNAKSKDRYQKVAKFLESQFES